MSLRSNIIRCIKRGKGGERREPFVKQEDQGHVIMRTVLVSTGGRPVWIIYKKPGKRLESSFLKNCENRYGEENRVPTKR